MTASVAKIRANGSASSVTVNASSTGQTMPLALAKPGVQMNVLSMRRA